MIFDCFSFWSKNRGFTFLKNILNAKIYFTITADPNYDQRMLKICQSLSDNGYDVSLIGVSTKKNQKPLVQKSFEQKRLPLFFKKGVLLFAESNIRFFFFLLFKKFDAACAIDLDTIMPVYFASFIRRKKRIYDAHELFCEMPEVISKPNIYKVWKWIEKTFVPKFPHYYTVNESLREEFKMMYAMDFPIIYNVPRLENFAIQSTKGARYLIYQGSVCLGRGFDAIIPAMRQIDAQLIICGDGNYLPTVKKMAAEYGVTHKIIFQGNVLPDTLKILTRQAFCGLNTVESKGKSYYLSLSNRTFDYMHAGIPQVAMNYPEYQYINNQLEIAILIDAVTEKNIIDAVNQLLTDKEKYKRLQENCLVAKQNWNWANEEKKLVAIYHQIFQ